MEMDGRFSEDATVFVVVDAKTQLPPPPYNKTDIYLSFISYLGVRQPRDLHRDGLHLRRGPGEPDAHVSARGAGVARWCVLWGSVRQRAYPGESTVVSTHTTSGSTKRPTSS